MRARAPGATRSARDAEWLQRYTAAYDLPLDVVARLVAASVPLDHADRTDALALERLRDLKKEEAEHGGTEMTEGELERMAATREDIVRYVPRGGDLAMTLASLRKGMALTLAALYDEATPPPEPPVEDENTWEERLRRCLCTEYEHLADATLAHVAAVSAGKGVAKTRERQRRAGEAVRAVDVRQLMDEQATEADVRAAREAHGRLCDFYSSEQCTRVTAPPRAVALDAEWMPRSSEAAFVNAEALACVVFGSESDVARASQYVQAERAWVQRQRKCAKRVARGGGSESEWARGQLPVLAQMAEDLERAHDTLALSDTACRPADDTVALLRWRGSRRVRTLGEAIETVAGHMVDQRSERVAAAVSDARGLAGEVVLRRVITGTATEWGAACAICVCSGERVRDTVWAALGVAPEDLVPFIDEVATMHPGHERARCATREYPCEYRTGDTIAVLGALVVAVDTRYGCRRQYRTHDLAAGDFSWHARDELRGTIVKAQERMTSGVPAH
jgi:hypothetical protein